MGSIVELSLIVMRASAPLFYCVLMASALLLCASLSLLAAYVRSCNNNKKIVEVRLHLCISVCALLF